LSSKATFSELLQTLGLVFMKWAVVSSIGLSKWVTRHYGEVEPHPNGAETISSLCAVIVGAPAIPRFSLLVNWRDSDTDRLLGMSSVEEGAMWHVDPLPSNSVNSCC
jgi:hypothetical protein